MGGLAVDLGLLAAVCAASVGAAVAMHVAVERPCLRWARRLRAEPGPLVPLVPT